MEKINVNENDDHIFEKFMLKPLSFISQPYRTKFEKKMKARRLKLLQKKSKNKEDLQKIIDEIINHQSDHT